MLQKEKWKESKFLHLDRKGGKSLYIFIFWYEGGKNYFPATYDKYI